MDEEQQQKFRNATSSIVRNAHCATAALGDTGNLLRIYLEPFDDAFRDAVRLCFEDCVTGAAAELDRVAPADPRLACLAELREKVHDERGLYSTGAEVRRAAYRTVLDMIDAMTEKLKGE